MIGKPIYDSYCSSQWPFVSAKDSCEICLMDKSLGSGSVKGEECVLLFFWTVMFCCLKNVVCKTQMKK